MSNSRLNKVWLAIAGIALIAAIVFFSGQFQGGVKPGVRIAINLPLTGPQAGFSGEVPAALRMGVEEAAKAKGLDPALFQIDAQDNQGATKTAITILEGHKRTGFDVYLSGLSTASVAIAPDLDKAINVPHFFIAFEAHITAGSANRFRTMPSYKSEGAKYPEYARMRGAKRVFILALNLAPVDEQFSKTVEPELTKMGVEFKREKYEIGTTDYRSLALKAIEFKPDLIMLNGLSFNLLPLIQNLKALGYPIDGNVLATMDLMDILYGDNVPPELEGVAGIAPPFEIPGRVAGADEWRARFIQRGGKVPNYVQAHAYDTGRMLVEAYAKNKSVAPDSLKSVFPFDGINGKVNLDDERDLITDLGFIRVTGGKRVPIVTTK